MNHTEFLKTLPQATRAALTSKSNTPALIRLALHFGLILTMGTYIAAKLPLWPALLLPQGILIIFLFTLHHECVHFTPFKTRALNLIVGHICSILILLPNTWFRYFHLAHHKHTNDPEKDPELEHPRPQTCVQYTLHISGIPTWIAQIRGLILLALRPTTDSFVPKAARARILWESRALLAFYTLITLLILTGQTWLLVTWIIPALLGQPFLRLYLLAEHGRCPNVANMFENTRTTFTTRIIRALAWNMPYHIEHHTYPAVPYHQLPNLHRLAQDHLISTSNGYTSFNRAFIKSLKP